MPKPDSKKQLLEYLAKSIVERPKAVKVTLAQSEGHTLLNLEVDPNDLGLIIGKRGKTIQAIRNLIRLQASRKGERVEVQLIDEKEKD
jgi:predicted RNA-binding protein YlqC (UPF0109 family)